VHKFSLLDCTDVERAILDKALQLWTARPYIGGKSSIGYGEVKLQYTEAHPEAYDTFMKENADSMRATIEKIEGILR
jgi:CRISPR/Cas system CSM-associated protein Csm3 (group 7 of RAMP superfamily)